MANSIDGNLMKDIVEKGYEAIKNVETIRGTLMSDLENAASASAGSTANLITIDNVGGIDISTGAGSLVLDNYLQELSTVEQAAAQIVAQANKAQKNVHSQTGQV